MKKALLILLLILCSCGGSKKKSPQAEEQIKDPQVEEQIKDPPPIKPLQKHIVEYIACQTHIGDSRAEINYLNKNDFYAHDIIQINVMEMALDNWTKSEIKKACVFSYTFEAYEGDPVYLEVNSMTGDTDTPCRLLGEYCEVDIEWIAVIYLDGEEWLRGSCAIKIYDWILDSYVDGDCDSIILEGVL